MTSDNAGLDEMKDVDLSLVSFSGDLVGGDVRPEKQYPMILEFRRCHDDVHALVHARSLAATGREFPRRSCTRVAIWF